MNSSNDLNNDDYNESDNDYNESANDYNESDNDCNESDDSDTSQEIEIKIVKSDTVKKHKENVKIKSNKVKNNTVDNVKKNKETSKNKDTSKKEEMENTIQYNQELMDKIVSEIKEPLKIFKNHCTLDVPKYKDEVLIAIMIKLKMLKDYKCHSPGCTVKKCWKRKPMQLFLNRKNNKKYDLRADNLELLCANCYVQNYGLQKLLIKTDALFLKCAICKYPLSNTKNNGKIYSKYCYVCSKKISQQAETEYENNYTRRLLKISGEKGSIDETQNIGGNRYSRTLDYSVNYANRNSKDTSSIFGNRNNNNNNNKNNQNNQNNQNTSLDLNMNLDLDLTKLVDEFEESNDNNKN
jgi:hypothetical protein